MAFTGYDLLNVEVVGHEACSIIDRHTIIIRMPGHRYKAVVAHNVAAEGERLMVDAHLAKKCGCQVALVTQSVYGAMFLDGTSSPYQGYVVVETGGFVDALITVAVIGQDDNEQVLPLRHLSQTVDKLAYAAI